MAFQAKGEGGEENKTSGHLEEMVVLVSVVHSEQGRGARERLSWYLHCLLCAPSSAYVWRLQSLSQNRAWPVYPTRHHSGQIDRIRPRVALFASHRAVASEEWVVLSQQIGVDLIR